MKMTIHRALAELKILDDRIAGAINEVTPVGYYQKGKKVGVKELDEFQKDAEAKLQSALALIERKKLLKRLIVESNSKTEITVGKATMTVADAITMKEIIKAKKVLADSLTLKFKQNLADMNRKNDLVQTNLQKLIESTFGRDNMPKIGTDDYENVRKPFMEANEWSFFDPLGVEKKIEEYTTEHTTFTMEVDAVLSESNAITTIEVAE